MTNASSRAGWWHLAGLAGLMLAVAQAVATQRDARRFPPPGTLVDVGGFRLHLVTRGPEHKGPTVVLEAGLGSFSSNWHWVQELVAVSTRVVAYDRAGLGWSDRSRQPRDARQLAVELHTALHVGGIPGPYVLAGHSFGGLPARMFCDLYPDETVGLVLVDASHPDQWARWPLHGADRILAASQWLQAALATVGLFRLVDVAGGVSEGLPDRQAAEMRARFALPTTSVTEARQMVAWRRRSREQVNAARPLGDLPLYVLGVTDQPMGAAVLTALQEELPGLSTNSVRDVVAGATHESLIGRQDNARVVADAILSVVEAHGHGQRLVAVHP